MPKPRPQKIEAWSYSRWMDYENCPFKAKCKYIDKLPTTQNQAMKRGTAVHKDAENYVKDTLPAMPQSLERFEEEFNELKTFKEKYPDFIGVEEQWALTNNWVPTGYFENNTWLRLKMDLWLMPEERTLKIVDYKTGKIRSGYGPQLELYAVSGFATFENIDTVITELWYLDQGRIEGGVENNEEGGVYTVDQYYDLEKLWSQRVRRMLNDTRFDPNPNRLCEWCDFSTAKGGPCQY